MKKLLIYGAAAIVVILGGLYAIGTMAKKSETQNASRPITEEELDEMIAMVDDQIEHLNTALVLCQVQNCEETADGRYVYQSEEGGFWYYADGEVVDMSEIRLKEE